MLVVIRGGGDIATGIALRLHRAGMEVVICETACPTAIRRTVCFSEAVRLGEAVVEGVTARRADLEEVPDILAQGVIPVLVDPTGACIDPLVSDAVVDAILAKRNLGTTIDMAPVVVAAGPGFTAGVDCHAVVETMRGHYLGRVVYDGSALPNTGVPGLIGGKSGERVLRAPADGIFQGVRRIGEQVREGDAAGYVDGIPMRCTAGPPGRRRAGDEGHEVRRRGPPVRAGPLPLCLGQGFGGGRRRAGGHPPFQRRAGGDFVAAGPLGEYRHSAHISDML